MFVFLSVLASLAFLFAQFGASNATYDRASIILVPGAFHQPIIYDKVTRLLNDAGYRSIHAIALPSVGTVNNSRDPDINAVRSVLESELANGKDVLLVGHSYGATIIGEAVKGLQSDSTQSSTLLKRFSLFWDGDLADAPPQLIFYNDLSTQQANFWVNKLLFSDFAALSAHATYIPYTGDFKCVYVMTALDNALPPIWQQTWIDQPGALFQVEYVNASHSSMLSKPKEVAEIIRKAAGEHNVKG
ncbi:uncharacterized protein BDR25DRAFT_225626 [Lindgomyces ingoldianus]|uniref:Uncharacterized protein n=1 Tax=Lindgomyces ingoldianus TaxID=673940 RepID=A0ACB6QVN9_9PLEO|nr:uncharacterized protein BDR25DRAFT_225626 [Lindgomyces ingoldianus]KAF2470352.1 hypothetical protein BDR25DRAFT_225626 [Lindgomyces ingoldianus]